MLDEGSFTVGDGSNVTHFKIEDDVLTLTNSDGTNGFNRVTQSYFDGWRLEPTLSCKPSLWPASCFYSPCAPPRLVIRWLWARFC